MPASQPSNVSVHHKAVAESTPAKYQQFIHV